jgi:PAS domain S-box-containing protein
LFSYAFTWLSFVPSGIALEAVMTALNDPAPERRGDADGQDARQSAPAGWAGDVGPVALAERLDEGAAAVHSVTPVKMVITLIGGLMAGCVLRTDVSVSWTLAALILAASSWGASRAQSRGRAINWRRRAAFLSSLVAEYLAWLGLGLLLWRAGSAAGEATAVAIWAAVLGIGVLLFYSAPAVFLAVGAAPAVAALAVVAMRGGLGWRDVLPIAVGVGLSLLFNLSRALETPSRQASQRRLNESLNQFRILAENVTDVIMRTDLDGRHQYVSPASLAVLGYRPDELVGRLRQSSLTEGDAAMMDTILERMLVAPDRSEVVTVQVPRKDGRLIWLQTSAKLVYEHGVPVAVIGVSRDVTERMAADKALLEAKAEAEAANRAKAEFLANVSHEIRTPMNGVLGVLHLLEREPISAEGRELMRQADDCGRMLSQLLNDVLDFSKIEAGQLELTPEPMHAGEALRTVTALLSGQARAKGIDLCCEVEGDNLWIAADPARLRQVIFNLVGNAVKFTMKGRVVARLAVAGHADDPGRRVVTLEVEDTGIGISAQGRQRLFERFRQAESDTARRFGGAGLGLAISQGLARALGGEITCASVEGEGSTFRLSFAAPAAEPPSAAPPPERLLDGVSILLVEDNPTNRLVARTILTRLGAQVEEAEDGVAGVTAATIGAHDLILMDVQMPRMNGVDATRAIRALAGPVSRTPIIGLTANVMVHQRAEYLAAGMDGVVAKPLSPSALLKEIARLLGGEPSSSVEAAAPSVEDPGPVSVNDYL